MERRKLDEGEQARLDALMDEAWANLPHHYQWLKDGAKIMSAGDREYTVLKVAKKHSGRYTVIVGNSAGIAIGRPATVRVS